MTVKEQSEILLKSMSQVVVGQDNFLRQVAIAFFSGGHVLLEGVPGLGKTLIAKALAKSIDGEYKRIQFTPDMMPSDIVGTNVFNLKTSEFVMRKGPVFTNVLLADEINRTPPKTQSALLEAMEERKVTIEGETMNLPGLFFVIATENPVEYEGTYPLPEAQVDRFMMKLNITYTEQKYEDEMLINHFNNLEGAHGKVEKLTPVLSIDNFKEGLEEIAAVKVEPSVVHYITDIVTGTRKSNAVMLGASPRASISLLIAAKTCAAMAGRDFVTPEDVIDVSLPVLRHRIILKPEAGIDGQTADKVLMTIIKKVEVPR